MDTVGRILQDERCGSSQLTIGLVHGGMETYLGSLTELKGTVTLDVIILELVLSVEVTFCWGCSACLEQMAVALPLGRKV